MAADGKQRGAEPALVLDPTPKRPNWHLLSTGPSRERRMDATDWRLRLDPDNIGVRDGWPERGLPSDAVPAEVPGVWNTIAPEFVGVGWYEAVFPRRFSAGTVRLVVGAANYRTDAWLNGVHLGRHEGGYDAFSFRCTHALREGANRLTLRIVDPPQGGEIDGLRLRECPTGKESWYGGYGGPWGGVWLERSSAIWIEDVRVHGDPYQEQAIFHVTLASDLPAAELVEMTALMNAPGAAFQVSEEAGSRVVGQARTAVRVASDGAVVELAVTTPSPLTWSPETPRRYFWAVTIQVPGDVRGDGVVGYLGFRTCEWRDGVFYLNGEPRHLKGALYQPTYPRTLVLPTRTGRLSDLRYSDLDLARQAGLNLLRFHLRPPARGVLEACDRRGIMAYVEPPLAWIEPSGRLLEHGKRELAAIIRACGNHPSVVLWGIFNENAQATEAVGGELLAELARLDPTRPIIENSGGAAVGETGMWAWGGQTRCWSPGWEAPRPLNDVHIYLANPLRREARELMATVGDGPTLDVTPGRAAGERFESRMSADAVLVSEYGCGALPDFEATLAAFGEETHLADAALLRQLRHSLTAGLAARGLDREIGDVASLVRQTQALQAEGIVAQTAALRRNPNVSGFILTQLADAGWEQMAGLVGYWRHPKPALDAFTRALAPRLLHVEMDDPCGRRQLLLRVQLIEEPGLQRREYHQGTLDVTIEDPHHPVKPAGALGQGDRWSAHRSSIAVGRQLGGETITMTAWLPTAPGRYQLCVRVAADDWAVEDTRAVLRLPDRAPAAGDGLVLLGNGLRRELPAAATTLPPDWSGPIIAYLPSRPTVASLKLAVERAQAGAHLCLVELDPAWAKRLEPLVGLPIGVHSGRGNFMGVHHYLRDHPIFDGVGAPCLADSVFPEVLPAWVAEELPGAEVLAGCFTVPDGGRGFLWRASLQTLAFGAGRLTICQFLVGARQGGTLGGHLLDRLVEWLT